MHLATVSQIICVIHVQTMHGYIRIQKGYHDDASIQLMTIYILL
jgi:hypothetical protein